MVLLPARSVPLVKEFAMTSLRLRMMEDMQVRNLSRHTQDSYLLQVSQFARHFAKSPALLGPGDIHAYQVYLTNEKKLAPRSVHVTVAALRFLYRVTLGLDWDFDRIIPCPKAPKTLAVILSPEEVLHFLGCIESFKHQAILTTCYAAGLRISEATRLKPEAIDRQRMVLRVEQVHAETGAALVPSPLTSFPGFPMAYGTPAATGPARTIQFLKSSTMPNEFLLATGTNSHFLLPRPTVEPCAGHIWTECHAVQENQRNAAIVARSFEPASFFTTVEPHHCAHRTVHNRRETRCHIAPFEEFLCCRACVFQAVCWTADELARLPCGFSASNGAAQIAATALPVAIPAN
jgi:hypothetical protein